MSIRRWYGELHSLSAERCFLNLLSEIDSEMVKISGDVEKIALLQKQLARPSALYKFALCKFALRKFARANQLCINRLCTKRSLCKTCLERELRFPSLMLLIYLGSKFI